jgi:hypothetical protein
MLGSKDLDFSKIGLIFDLNSTPIICGTFEIADSTAYAMPKLECGLFSEELKTFIRTSFQKPMRTCSGILRMNVLGKLTFFR